MNFQNYKYLVTYADHPYAYHIVKIINEIKSFNEYNEPTFYFNVSPCPTCKENPVETARLDDLIKINELFSQQYTTTSYYTSSYLKGW